VDITLEKYNFNIVLINIDINILSIQTEHNVHNTSAKDLYWLDVISGFSFLSIGSFNITTF